jgi:hypothetical protein
VVFYLVINGKPIDQSTVRLAEAYIPYQRYANLYPVEEALQKGTIFADLYRPYPKKYKKK